MNPDALERMRRDVSKVNLEILRLLAQRGRLVLQIAELKRRLGMQLADPVREQEMLAELAASNPGPYTDEMIAAIYREVFKVSRELMKTRVSPSES